MVNFRRVCKDLKNLAKKYSVGIVPGTCDYDFSDGVLVKYEGPVGSLYEGFKWMVLINLPDAYPHQPPALYFRNKIFHPNICYQSGNVCINSLNEDWLDTYDLVHVFDVSLAFLLHNPNVESPLNVDAAKLRRDDEAAYNQRVMGDCEAFARGDDIDAAWAVLEPFVAN